MIILWLTVPVWLLLLVVIVVAFLFDYRHRRLQQRVNELERVIDYMDRWADAVEDKIKIPENASPARVLPGRHFANNERFE